MNNQNDHAYFNCDVVREKVKSHLVRLECTGEEYWVPKSLCELKLADTNGLHVLEVEAWFARKEGMGD